MKTAPHNDICREVRNATILAAAILIALLALCHFAKGAEGARANAVAEGAAAAGLPQAWRTPEADSADLVMEFDPLTGNARWVMARVTADTLKTRAERSDRFFPEPTLPSQWAAIVADYKGTGFDRGHGIGARFFAGDQAAQDRTFSMLNMFPEPPDVNRIFLGQHIEPAIAAQAVHPSNAGAVDLYIAFVPIYRLPGQPMSPHRIGASRLAVPRQLCFAVLVTRPNRVDKPLRMVGWRVPNQPVPRKHRETDYRESIDAIELLAGAVDVFPNVPDELEAPLEAATFRE